MKFIHKINSVARNKVFLYVSSRYVTYGLQFVNSIILAVVLEDYFPVYGFILIILQYISLTNLGVPYSLNVFLALNKDNDEKMDKYLSTSVLIYLFLFILISAFFYILPHCGIHIGTKYQFDNYVLFVVAIGLLALLNALMSNYYRVINRLGEIVFLQSVIPLGVFVALLFAKGKFLLDLILWIMFLGNLIALVLFLKNKKSKKWMPDLSLVNPILRKAFFLFLYNTFFYLILLSIRTLVSSEYSISDFALFTFSFTIANAIVLLFESFAFLIYPKTINRLNKADTTEVFRILDVIKVNYVTSIHLAMYLFILLYPFLVSFFPQYNTTFKCFALITMTISLYSNCFAYSSFLTAKGKEKLLSVLAFMALTINVLIALAISSLLKLSYEYMILSTMVAYLIYTVFLGIATVRILRVEMSMIELVKSVFPFRLFFPFAFLLVLILIGVPLVYFVAALALFIFTNRTQLTGILKTIKRILSDSSIIDI